MRLQEEAKGNAVVVKLLDARFDATTAPLVREGFARLIDQGHQRIALDISDVEFIDSSGLSVAVWALKRLGGNGQLVIGGVRANVMSIFRLTQLDKILRVFEDKEMAVAALRE
jgi:anti-sigma B factor antagonist